MGFRRNVSAFWIGVKCGRQAYSGGKGLAVRRRLAVLHSGLRLETFRMRLLALLFLPFVVFAQTQVNLSQQSRGTLPSAALPSGVKQIPTATVATLPGSPAVDDLAIVTDCESSSTCATGGGAFRNLLIWSGAAWEVIGDGGAGGQLTIESQDSAVGPAGVLDFGRDFQVSESPTSEANIELDRPNTGYAHTYATSGDGTVFAPWAFPSGNPWAGAVHDGAKVVTLVPGHYWLTSCPAEIPAGVTITGLNRESTTIRVNCNAIENQFPISAVSGTSPVTVSTFGNHGLATGDWVRIGGVAGATSVNGIFQLASASGNQMTLSGAVANGTFTSTGSGSWVGQVHPIAGVSAGDPIQVDTDDNHGFVSGDRVLISGVTGQPAFQVNGFWMVTTVDLDSFTLDGGVRIGGNVSGGFVWKVNSTNAISTADVRGVELKRVRISTGGSENFLANVVRVKASESVFEEVEGRFLGADAFDALAPNFTGGQSGSVKFTGNSLVGQQFTLTQTGGGSRATAPYPSITMVGASPVTVSSISSVGGSPIRVFTSGPHFLSSGLVVDIDSTTETVAAGAAGTFKVAVLDNSTIDLVGSNGSGNSCGPCGGAQATHSQTSAAITASSLANSLNQEFEFSRDYFAVAVGSELHFTERKIASTPAVFSVSTPIPHTTTAWALTNRGGNTFLLIDSNSFSSRFSRIFSGGVHKNFHLITLTGVNNQQSIRDSRLSGGLNAGWGIRFVPNSTIQNIDVFNFTTESAYGAVEIGAATGTSIRTIYMEGVNEFGVRVLDRNGAAGSGGFSFVHGVSISNGIILGNTSLDLIKAKGVTVEGVVAASACKIGAECEDCVILASWLTGCTVDSPSGYIDAVTFLRGSIRPVDRYGSRLSTPSSALVDRPISNLILRSEDLTAFPWVNNGSVSSVTADDPFGNTRQISRTSVLSPGQFSFINAATHPLSGLLPDTRYSLTYWTRVVTPGATCGIPVGVNNRPFLKDTDGWVRLAGSATTNSVGSLDLNLKCHVQEAGLPDMTFDIFGVMLSETFSDGALPPYVATAGSSVVAGRGLYIQNGTIEAPNSSANIAPGGSAVACGTYVVTQSDLTAASTVQDVALFNLPARGKLTGLSVKHSQSFAGGGVSSMTVSVGDVSSPTFYSNAFSVSQGVSDTAQQDTLLFKSSTAAARDVSARFTSTGANVSAATSGNVDIAACWVQLP